MRVFYVNLSFEKAFVYIPKRGHPPQLTLVEGICCMALLNCIARKINFKDWIDMQRAYDM